MKQFIKQMKDRLSFFNKGQETSFFYNKSNSSIKYSTKEFNNLFQENFRNSASRNPKKKQKVRSIPKFTTNSKYDSNKNSFLLDLKKISPMRSLKYQLELYEQKQRYGCHKNEKLLYTPYKKSVSFLKDDYKKPYDYKPSLQKNYISLKKQSCKGKFSSNYKNNNKNKYILIPSNIFKKNNKTSKTSSSRPKSCIKTSSNFISQKTNSSRVYSSSRLYSQPNTEHTKIYKNINKEIKKKINKAILEVNNASIELKQEIYFVKKYDETSKLRINSPKKCLKKSKSCININEIKKEFKLNEKKRACIKRTMENRYKYLDKYSKKVLRDSINKIKIERRILGKDLKGKYDDFNEKQALQKLQDGFKEIGKNILNIKKKYKGDSAIIPKNEVEFIHRLIKENMWDDHKEDENLDNYITKSTMNNRYLKSSKKKIEGRLAFLHKKSVNEKNKYLYNHS